jgi:ElaB/YqjD/DUF883 family membrane-anchored ribosome-binding protein
MSTADEYRRAAALREAKANVESVIADAGDKGQQALKYARQKGHEAMDNVREVGNTLAVAIEKSVTKRPYTTLLLAVVLGFLFGVRTIGARRLLPVLLVGALGTGWIMSRSARN